MSSSQFEFSFGPLTKRSVLYAVRAAQPMFRSNGWGGTGSSAPGISCAAGSSHTNKIINSTTTSWVLGPAAARRCLSMVRQYSSDQSWSTLLRRKTETPSGLSSLCHIGCGSKKLCAFETPKVVSPNQDVEIYKKEKGEPWIFTRPDSSALGMLLFQYCSKYILSEHTLVSGFNHCAYLGRIAHDRISILDNKAELRVMVGER
jgi:hypothetical protein